MSIDEGITITMPCTYCGIKEARGTRYVYEDYQVEFKCACCGKISVLGNTEADFNESKEYKSERESAEDKRRRYRRERDEEFTQKYHKALEDSKALPDAVSHFQDTIMPQFNK